MAKKINKDLPGFSRGEERFSAITHIVGAGLGVVFLVVGVLFAVWYSDTIGIVSMSIYGGSMIILYTMSSLYHFLRPVRAKKVFRIFDHCTIFLLIAGTYTPICLIALRNSGAWGYAIFGAIWFLAILGMVFNGINMHWKAVKILSMTFYLLMGWCIVVAIFPLLEVLRWQGFMWMLAGGLAYTIGAVFYGFGKRKKYIHSVWHLFVLLGTIFHFVGILLYVVIGI